MLCIPACVLDGQMVGIAAWFLAVISSHSCSRWEVIQMVRVRHGRFRMSCTTNSWRLLASNVSTSSPCLTWILASLIALAKRSCLSGRSQQPLHYDYAVALVYCHAQIDGVRSLFLCSFTTLCCCVAQAADNALLRDQRKSSIAISQTSILMITKTFRMSRFVTLARNSFLSRPFSVLLLEFISLLCSRLRFVVLLLSYRFVVTHSLANNLPPFWTSFASCLH